MIHHKSRAGIWVLVTKQYDLQATMVALDAGDVVGRSNFEVHHYWAKLERDWLEAEELTHLERAMEFVHNRNRSLPEAPGVISVFATEHFIEACIFSAICRISGALELGLEARREAHRLKYNALYILSIYREKSNPVPLKFRIQSCRNRKLEFFTDRIGWRKIWVRNRHVKNSHRHMLERFGKVNLQVVLDQTRTVQLTNPQAVASLGDFKGNTP